MRSASLCAIAIASIVSAHDVDFAGRSTELLSESFACTACEVLTHVAETWMDSPLTIDIGEMLATAYCMNNKGALGWKCSSKWACHDLCTNAVKTFGPTAIYIGSRILFDPTTNCIKLGVCPNTTETAAAVGAEAITPFFPAPLLSDAAEPAPAPTAPEDILRVVQVTDIHWDPSSTAGANADCGEPLCCRPVQGAPADEASTCGFYGDHAGDTPTSLLHTMYESIAALDPRPDFAFFTGDDPAHNVWNQTREYNVGVTRNMSRIVREYLGDMPVFFALGNHNGFPVNIFNTDVEADQEWLYRPLAEAYAPWLDEAAQATFAHAGYYSMAVPGHPHLRVIALNTPLVVHDNWFTMLGHDPDTGNMTSWMLREVAAAAGRGDTVYLLGHHPPNGAYLREWMEGVFSPMVSKYRSTIAGVFLGHTHKAMLQLIRDGTGSDSAPVAAAYVGAAPTPYGDINPTYRVYEIHRATGEVLDYTDYTVDMEGQGLLHNVDPAQPKPQWRPAYSARAAYNMTSLRPAEWQRLAMRMQDDDALFRTWEMNYVTNNARRANFSPSERVTRVCDILGGTADLFTRCKAHFAQKLAELEA